MRRVHTNHIPLQETFGPADGGGRETTAVNIFDRPDQRRILLFFRGFLMAARDRRQRRNSLTDGSISGKPYFPAVSRQSQDVHRSGRETRAEQNPEVITDLFLNKEVIGQIVPNVTEVHPEESALPRRPPDSRGQSSSPATGAISGFSSSERPIPQKASRLLVEHHRSQRGGCGKPGEGDDPTRASSPSLRAKLVIRVTQSSDFLDFLISLWGREFRSQSPRNPR